jgi:hypothetical protein
MGSIMASSEFVADGRIGPGDGEKRDRDNDKNKVKHGI